MSTRGQQDWMMDPSDSQCFLNAMVSAEVAEIMTAYGNYFKKLEAIKTETMNELGIIMSKYHPAFIKESGKSK